MRYDREEGLFYFADDAFIHLVNDWPQLLPKGWNWITFRFLLLSFENDYMIPGWEVEVIVMGLGFRIRANRDMESTESGRRIKRSMEEIEAGTAKLVSLGEALEEDNVQA